MEAELKNHIAAVIRAARRSKGLTQEDVADRIRRTPESLSNLERGQAVPSVETVISLCEVLEIPIERLLSVGSSPVDRGIDDHRIAQEIALIVEQLNGKTLTLAKVQLEALLNFQTELNSKKK